MNIIDLMYFNDDDNAIDEETTNYCPYVNDTVFCNGNCSKCGNKKD